MGAAIGAAGACATVEAESGVVVVAGSRDRRGASLGDGESITMTSSGDLEVVRSCSAGACFKSSSSMTSRWLSAAA